MPFIFVVGLLFAGCASSQPASRCEVSDRDNCSGPDQSDKRDQCDWHAPNPITTLAFDPAIAGGRPLYTISRDDRGLAASLGYEPTSIEYYDVETEDDLEYYHLPGYYQHDSVSDKQGVIFH